MSLEARGGRRRSPVLARSRGFHPGRANLADPNPPGRFGAAAGLGAAMVLLVAVALGLLLRTDSPSGVRTPGTGRTVARADYVGDVSCRDCHPGEFAAHSGSGHSKTLRRAVQVALRRGWDSRTTPDPEQPGVSWKFQVRDGRLWVERSAAQTPGGIQAERFAIDYALGSGRHATTLVTMVDRDPRHPTIREHRLTFFGHADGFGLTPGQSLAGHASGNTPAGRIHSADDTLKCFGCHATMTSDRGFDQLDPATIIPDVTCERCHGPARAHVEAARRGDAPESLHLPFGLDGSPADEELRLCGTCHRLPEMLTSNALSTANPVIVRYQPIGLMQSACFRGSDGAMACTTCHDPHSRTSSDRAAYEAACLSCHDRRRVHPCPLSNRSGCVDCHMPRRDVARGMIMTDHWIRVDRPDSARIPH